MFVFVAYVRIPRYLKAVLYFTGYVLFVILHIDFKGHFFAVQQ